MDPSMHMKEREIESDNMNISFGSSHSKKITTTIFPPNHQSQSTSPNSEGFEEEPSLNKSVVYIHQKSSEKQQRLDSAWIHKDKEEEEEESGNIMNKKPVYPSLEKCNRFLSSRWQRENEDEDEETRKPMGSAVNILKQKLKEYGREWKDGISLQTKWGVTEACVRVLCSNFIWCLVLGTWLEQKTEKKWGIVEIVIANIVCGSLFQFLGGQSLIIVGPSSPCLIFIVAISTSAKHLRIEALPWMGWIGIWASLFLLLLALSNASKLILRHMTLFSWGVVCVFIRLTFLWAALEQLIHLFVGSVVTLDSALLSLWLATVTFFVSAFLSNAPRWHLFSHRTRSAVADYGMVFVLLLFTGVSHLPRLTQPHVVQVSLPEPVYHTDQTTRISIITLRILPSWAILLSIIPGILLAGMIFVYQNAMASFIQDKAGLSIRYKSSQRWDLCILAFLTLLCGLFGLPFTCGMSHQTYVHLRALTLKHHEHSEMEEQRGMVKRVAVQRISSMGAALLSVTFFLPPSKWVINRIPCAVLIGLLLQLAFLNWGSWSVLIFIRTFLTKSQLKSQEMIAVCVYSATQISFIFTLFVMTNTPAAVLFPLIFFISLWIRHYAMRGVFKKQGFAILDAKLYKDVSDLSSLSELSSMLSPRDANTHSPLGWPKFSIEETMKPYNAPGPPCVDTKTQLEICESPMGRVLSPSLLFVSNRRLKERSRRRHKKKRQASDEDDSQTQGEQESGDIIEQLDHEIGGIPPLIRAIMKEEEEQQKSYIEQQQYRHEKEINLCKRLSPSLSPRFFKKSKGQESPLEVHSNLLYDPPPSKSNVKRVKKVVDDECKKVSDGASTSAISGPNENVIPNCGQIMVFQGSPGIGRCIRSPPTFSRTNKSRKRKQLHLSFPAQAFWREDVYSSLNDGQNYLVRKPNPKPLVYPRLQRSTTGKSVSLTYQPNSLDQFQSTSISPL